MHTKKLFASLFGRMAVLGALTSVTAFGADLKILPGHVPGGLSQLPATGRVSPTNRMRLAIGVPLRDPAGLGDFLAQLHDPASPNFRKYLTPEEFAARFGPTEQAYETVKKFALANGLTIEKTYGNRLVLDVTGPAAAVEKALHITLRTYQHPTEARQFFAPDTEPTVAADLPVVDIQGLSDFSKPHPKFKRTDRAKAVPKGGSGSNGGYFGDDFRNAYVPGTTLTGAGQTVGLLEYDGYIYDEIEQYASDAGGGRDLIDIENVYVDGYDGSVQSTDGNSEVSLDIEMAMAMAPGLTQILVFETENGNPQNDLLNSMASYTTVACLGCSWGWSGPSATTDAIFMTMAAQGQSFFNASGDSDAFTVGANSVNGVDNLTLDNGPSSSPYITQVGGTTLTMKGEGVSYTSEKVWNWGRQSDGSYAGSCGGVSSYYGIPNWQTGISMTGNKGSTTWRNIPDVALTADNICVYDDDGYGDLNVDNLGGTSCAAPLWAGFLALVNEQAANLGQPPAGFINPEIYSIGKGQAGGHSYANCFHDITTGNNFWSSSPSQYSAVAGYDLCSGWGTPKGTNLINALAAPLGYLGVLPQTISLTSGLAGGPFVTNSAAFQLTNVSMTAMNWSLVNTSSWLHVVTSNGTLAGFASVSLGVSLTTNANNLKVGTYAASLALSNHTQKVSQRLAVTLQVTPALSVSPAQGFTAVGPVGGPFTPDSQIFVLANAGAGTQGWKLIKTNSWLSISATNGALVAGGQTNITVGLTAAANTLKAGPYNSSLVFTNSFGLIAVVPFTLSVGTYVYNGGFETGDFTGWTQSGNTALTTVTTTKSFVHSGKYGAQLGPWPSPGYLSQTVQTVPGQAYKLSLWLSTPTSDYGITPNWFQVQWNGSIQYDEQDLIFTGWKNLQFVVTATDVTSTLQLGFDDDPWFLGLDDISLTPTTAVMVEAATAKAGDFQLVGSTRPNAVYQVQYKTNLSQPGWINLGKPVTASAGTLLLTHTNALQTSPQRFYRLLELP